VQFNKTWLEIIFGKILGDFVLLQYTLIVLLDVD
jgi:hypothetical protein